LTLKQSGRLTEVDHLANGNSCVGLPSASPLDKQLAIRMRRLRALATDDIFPNAMTNRAGHKPILIEDANQIVDNGIALLISHERLELNAYCKSEIGTRRAHVSTNPSGGNVFDDEEWRDASNV
jgi:hypothetical protein